jgi:MFS transporter, DHA2 family, multidrug resistance protein
VEGEVRGGAPAVNPWIVAVAVMFGTFMEVLDTTVVNVSLPHIAGNLSATTDEATWALTSYLVANAIILPITGWLARYFGRKRLLMSALSGFTLSSLLCGMAPSLSMLILFRIIQGMTGGALQPLSQAVMLEAFHPAERGKAMAFWGLGIVVAPMLGPILGGWLTDNYSWRWVFYINLPVGIASLFMTKLYIHDPVYMKRSPGRIDTWGIGLLAVGIGALQIMLDKGQQDDWFSSRLIVCLATVAVLLLVVFVIHELRTPHPVLQLRALRDSTYAVGVTLMTVLGFVLYGSLVILPVFLQTLLRYPAVQAGTATAPRGLGSFLSMPLVGFILGRIDPRKLLAAGMAFAALTLIQLSFLNLDAGYWNFFWPQFFQGMSLALVFVPLTTVTMDRIPKEEMGNATSLFNLMRNLGAGFGIAAATTMISRNTQSAINRLGEHFTAYNPSARALLSGIRRGYEASGADPATAAQRSWATAFGLVQQQAALQAFLDTFRLFGMIFLLVLPLLFLLRRPTHRARPSATH